QLRSSPSGGLLNGPAVAPGRPDPHGIVRRRRLSPRRRKGANTGRIERTKGSGRAAMPTAPSRAIMLFGTEQEVAPPKTLRAGPLTVEFEHGNLRYVRYRGVEVLRGIAFLVRDPNWATYGAAIEDLKIGQGPDSFTIGYQATCSDAS